MKTITKKSLRDFRKSKGMTQSQMAEYMGVGIHTIQSWEQDSNSRKIPKRLNADPRTKHLVKEVKI